MPALDHLSRYISTRMCSAILPKRLRNCPLLRDACSLSCQARSFGARLFVNRSVVCWHSRTLANRVRSFWRCFCFEVRDTDTVLVCMRTLSVYTRCVEWDGGALADGLVHACSLMLYFCFWLLHVAQCRWPQHEQHCAHGNRGRVIGGSRSTVGLWSATRARKRYPYCTGSGAAGASGGRPVRARNSVSAAYGRELGRRHAAAFIQWTEWASTGNAFGGSCGCQEGTAHCSGVRF